MLVNQAEFARLHDVSRKTVTKWKSQSWLVFEGDLVDVEKSNELIKKYRAEPVTQVVTPSVTQALPVTRHEVTHEVEPGETVEEAAKRIIAADASLDLNEARRVKENYLALLSELEYRQKSGVLVDLEMAQTVLFEESRLQRDAWLNFPTRNGAMMASELGLSPDIVTEVLTKYVYDQIELLGECRAEFK